MKSIFFKHILLFNIVFLFTTNSFAQINILSPTKRVQYLDAITTISKKATNDSIKISNDSTDIDLSVYFNIDSINFVESAPLETNIPDTISYILFKKTEKNDSIVLQDKSLLYQYADSIIRYRPYSRTEYLTHRANTLLIDLVHYGWKFKNVNDDENSISIFEESKIYDPLNIISFEEVNDFEFVKNLRDQSRQYFTNNHLSYYKTTIDQLPDISDIMLKSISGADIASLVLENKRIEIDNRKIELNKIKQIHWIKKANALLQFSQNHISNNWHQGGNSNYSFLSILNGEINYNNLKNVIWENKFEWRVGYNKIQSEKALRNMNLNDDIARLISKFGVKAGGNWYYSITGEASTQLFNNYRSFDSDVLKAMLFTPIRANIGVGMDYKIKNFSLTLAPLSFKYIYLNDTTQVNPNLFGIEKGVNQLKQYGSTFRSEFKTKPMKDWNLESRLTFYTDYKKLEIDLDIVNNFVINRFLTARLQLNPRFDNTIILKEGEKSRIQFKELMSIGFSYRFL